MALKPSRSYKDLSLTFKTNPLKKDLVILKDENAIKRSLLNLFSIRRGEKFFDSTFGSGIPDLLFEPFDYITAGTIKDNIVKLIQTYEPRISVRNVLINLNDDENTYEIEIEYLIPETSGKVYNVGLSLSSSSRV